MISKELKEIGAPDPGENRWFNVIVKPAGRDDEYAWDDGVTVVLVENQPREVGLFRKHIVMERHVVGSSYTAIKDLKRVEDIYPTIRTMCYNLIGEDAIRKRHRESVNDLVKKFEV